MRKKTLSLLVSPNNTNVELEIYANELVREEKVLSDLRHGEILDTDDVKSGFLINKVNGNIFPIHDFVLSLLSEEDIDNFFYKKLFTKALNYCPEEYLTALKDNIAKLDRQSDSDTAAWNKEEMKYYD
ncbi:MAG: hypothetical protein NXI23_10865 [Bacteroidetes bacterium]|nr:hypothetical protein [Bacteroidota bacterium]